MLATYTRLTLLAVTVLSGLVFESSGQVTPLYNYQSKFSTTDGLPHGYILSLLQDSDGFIWIGTADGLARYDGKSFRQFQANQEDSTGLRFNNIHGLLLINDRLWLFYFNEQVGRMDPRTFDVVHFPTLSDPAQFGLAIEAFKSLGPALITDVSGKDWIDGTMDLPLALKGDQQKLAYAYANTSKTNGRIYGLTQDDSENLWFLVEGGLAVSRDNSWNEFIKVPFPVGIKLRPGQDYFGQLFKLSDGRIVTIVRDHVLICDPTNKSFRVLPIPIATPEGQDFIVRVCRDNSGRLIFSSKGYVFLLTEEDQLNALWKMPESDFSNVSALLIDRTNTLWVGTPGYGLYSINMQTPSIKSRGYTLNFLIDLLEGEMGIPLNTIPGIWKINREKQHWLRSFYDSDGNIYISNHGGVRGKGPFIFRLEGKKFVPIPSSIERSIVGIKENAEGLWALNQDGEMLFWSDKKRPPSLIKVTGLHDSVNSPAVFDLEGDEEFLWIASKIKGLYQLRGTELVDHFPPASSHDGGLPNFEISDIINDPEDSRLLWVGTLGGGLVKWDKTTKSAVATYTTEDGLPNNSVGGIVPDNQGRLWISTNMGLSVMDKQDGRVTNYSSSDGLFEDELQRFMHFKLPDGRIAFGGANGYSVIDPGEFQRDESEPNIHLTGLYLANEPVDHSTNNSVLPESLNTIDRIDLEHDQNTIGFDIAAMQFNNPGKNRFRYKLLNHEDSWVDVGSDQHIRFSRLPYGSYTLVVGATNTSGVWSPNERELFIRIHPPWYFTWWAYVLYGASVTVAVWLLWKNARQRLHQKQEVEFEKREALRLRELDETKSRFFSNVTHEFRTPLTLILSPLEKFLNSDEPVSPPAKKLLNRTYQHASQLLRLVNQLLDVAKLESGKMIQNNTVGELSEFILKIVQPFRDQAEERNIQFIFENKNVEGHFLFDHSKWEKIVSNLLSNASKFTTRGSIGVIMEVVPSEGRNTVRLIVSDTGIGIPRKLHPKIFDRFYQVDDSATRKHEGTGIGLSLVKELVDLMNGTIAVESEQGVGTTFNVDLPVDRIIDRVVNVNQGIEEVSTRYVDESQPLLLVVEDNEELRSFLVESLSGHWTCLQAADGLRAWEIIEKELPDLVISDVMMPGMNGYQLCAKSKQDPGTMHISFILLTARAAQEAVVEGLEAGADEYVTKPFHLHELELRITNLLHQQNNLRRHLQDTLFPQKPHQAQPTVKDVFLQNLYDFVNANLNEEMDPERIANEMAMSRSTLNRKLKSLTNLSITEFVRQLRLQKSLELIHAGYNISEIAYQVGFESHSYFSRCFKERFQKTPTEYAETRVA